MDKKNIAILFGGKSTEHEGSIESALHIIHNIDKEKFNIHAVYVKNDGNIASPKELINEIANFMNNKLITIKPSLEMETEIFEQIIIEAACFPKGNDISKIDFYDNLLLKKYDAVFPIFHGLNGEDGTIQGLLRFVDVPCVGCGLNGSAVCIDKEITKILCDYNGINTTKFKAVRDYQWRKEPEKIIDSIELKINYPMFVKPARLGSSIGISRVENREELIKGIETAFRYDSKAVIEEGIAKPREFAVGVFGFNDDVNVAEIGEFQSYKENFFDYEAKYGSQSLNGIIPAVIGADIKEKLVEMAKKAFIHLEIDGFARIDIFYDGNDIYLNEVNTIPGLETHGTFSKTWVAAGISRKEFITEAIEKSIADFIDRKKFVMKIEQI